MPFLVLRLGGRGGLTRWSWWTDDVEEQKKSLDSPSLE